MPLRVVEGASKFIEGASLYKTIQPPFRASEMHSPFGGWRHHLSPAGGGTITRAYCSATYEGTAFQSFIVPPLAGEVRHSRIGGGERSEPVTRMLIMSYDTESKSRNVLASPLGEEGHEVAKGVQANWIHRGAPRPANPVRRHPAKSVWTRVRMIMILDVDVTAERRHYNTHRPQGDTATLGLKGRQT